MSDAVCGSVTPCLVMIDEASAVRVALRAQGVLSRDLPECALRHRLVGRNVWDVPGDVPLLVNFPYRLPIQHTHHLDVW